MAIKTTKDGRVIRSGSDYADFRRDLWRKQRWTCCTCSRITGLDMPIESDYSFHVAHRGSRGMGGGFRDDVVGTKRGQVEGGKCGGCHRKEHGQG